MGSPRMFQPIIPVISRESAVLTLVLLYNFMTVLMFQQTFAVPRSIFTIATPKRLQARVRSFMASQITIIGGHKITIRAHESFPSYMHFFMFNQIGFSIGGEITKLAQVLLALGVFFNVIDEAAPAFIALITMLTYVGHKIVVFRFVISQVNFGGSREKAKATLE